MNTFEKELEDLLNKHGEDSKANVPNYLLANYLVRCLRTIQLLEAGIKKYSDGENS